METFPWPAPPGEIEQLYVFSQVQQEMDSDVQIKLQVVYCGVLLGTGPLEGSRMLH